MSNGSLVFIPTSLHSLQKAYTPSLELSHEYFVPPLYQVHWDHRIRIYRRAAGEP